MKSYGMMPVHVVMMNDGRALLRARTKHVIQNGAQGVHAVVEQQLHVNRHVQAATALEVPDSE